MALPTRENAIWKMSNKSRYNPVNNQSAPISQEMTDKITMKMIESFMGMNSNDGETAERPKTCGECGYCNGTTSGIRCFALPPKIVWVHEDDGEGGRVFNSTQIRPKVDLGDPGCSLGVRR